MNRRLYVDYLRDMLEAIDDALRFTDGMTEEQFLADRKTAYATLRAVEIVGEAVKHILDSVRERCPGVPWRDMAGLRDVVAHQYHRVDMGVVWVTVRDRLPSVRSDIESSVREEDRHGGGPGRK